MHTVSRRENINRSQGIGRLKKKIISIRKIRIADVNKALAPMPLRTISSCDAPDKGNSLSDKYQLAARIGEENPIPINSSLIISVVIKNCLSKTNINNSAREKTLIQQSIIDAADGFILSISIN